MDIIYLRDLRVETIIGVYPWERCIRQIVIIDIDMAVDINVAAMTDSIEGTINYSAVAKRINEFVYSSEFKLIETLAVRLAEVLMVEFHMPWLKLKINKKGAVRGAKDVGIIIERGQRK